MLPFDQAALEPLTTDVLIQQRVADLVGRAIRRQLWLFFLDENSVQLPLVMPCDDLPVYPPDDPVPVYADFAEGCGATSIVAVLERFGDDELTPADTAWARHLHDSCAGLVPLRAVLLSHRRGIRWIAEDDYLF
jgi:hypothetical protein